MVLLAVKEVLLSLSPSQSLYEGLLRYDFKIGEPRLNLMQVSFSSLAAWPLFLVLFILWLDPTQWFFSLGTLMLKIFGEESSFRFFLLNGQISTMASVLALFFFLQWMLRKEYLWIGILFYFLLQSQLHLHLALAGLIGVFVSRAAYLWWIRIDLVSRTRRIWTWATSLQLIATLFVSAGSLFLLDHYQKLRYFSGSFAENRFLFLFSVVFFFYFFHFVFLSIWGHFTFQNKSEPSYVPIYFSSATWIGRFHMRSVFESQLKDKANDTLKHHLASLNQLQEMKDQSPGLRLGALEETLNQELVYVQMAASRLTTS